MMTREEFDELVETSTRFGLPTGQDVAELISTLTWAFHEIDSLRTIAENDTVRRLAELEAERAGLLARLQIAKAQREVGSARRESVANLSELMLLRAKINDLAGEFDPVST